jgi:hypothetical protein
MKTSASQLASSSLTAPKEMNSAASPQSMALMILETPAHLRERSDALSKRPAMLSFIQTQNTSGYGDVFIIYIYIYTGHKLHWTEASY